MEKMNSQYEEIAVKFIEKYGRERFDGFAHFSAIKGRYYEDQKNLRLMIVGRCTNGWHSMSYGLSSAEFGDVMERSFVESNQNGFDWIAADHTNGNGYRLSKSKFWNYTGEVWRLLNQRYNKPPVDLEKYGDRWYEFTVWSNLYKITEQGKTPGLVMTRAQAGECMEILKEEIDSCKPSIIIMEIDSSWFTTFSTLFSSIEVHPNPVVKITARRGDSLVLVTSRPEVISKELFCSSVLEYIV